MPETNGKERIKLYERVSNLETNFNYIKEDLTLIKTNHLPHIDTAVNKCILEISNLKKDFCNLSKSVKVVGGIVVSAIVVNIVVNLIFK